MLLFGGQSFDVKNIFILTTSIEYMISANALMLHYIKIDSYLFFYVEFISIL